MTLTPKERHVLFQGLAQEESVAPPALAASSPADRYDRPMARLLMDHDPAVVDMALVRLADETPVRMAAWPHEPLDGGYGQAFGPITVGHKARYLLRQLLGPTLAAEAFAEGPVWRRGAGRNLRWDALAGRFVR